MITDSGNRSSFASGAVRDIQEGKGRCDLLPLKEVAFVMEDPVLDNIHRFIHSGSECFIKQAIQNFCVARGWTLSNAMLEVSIHYEEGCKKYGDRNWEKGIPLSRFVDSGIRHYLKWLRGDDDESHDRAFVWNMLGLLWTYANRLECNDLCEDK